MKRILLGLLLVPVLAFANVGGPELQKSLNDVRNQASLQNGAKIFMNYCIGCHSMKYSRFERVGVDLGIPDDLLRKDIMFTAEKPGELMNKNGLVKHHLISALQRGHAAPIGYILTL